MVAQPQARRKTDPNALSQAPRGFFSRDLEREARAHAWDNTWKNKKRLVLAFYLIDVGGALMRALMHVALWVPAIVLWPLLLSTNHVAPQEVLDWVQKVAGGGWDGSLMKLIGAVFVVSLGTQLLQGGVGDRLRRYLDRHMERSLLWSLMETQLPLASADDQPIDAAPTCPCCAPAKFTEVSGAVDGDIKNDTQIAEESAHE